MTSGFLRHRRLARFLAIVILPIAAAGPTAALAAAATVPKSGWALYATYNAAGPAPRFSDPCFVHYTVAAAPAFSKTWTKNVNTGLARVVRLGTKSFASAGLRKFGIHFDDEADGIAKFGSCYGSKDTRVPDTTHPGTTTPSPTTRPPCGSGGCDLRATLPGTWRWFASGDVIVDANGTFRQPLPNLTGTWRIEGARVVMTWSHGYTDKLMLVGATRLEGFGSRDPNATTGHAVWGDKSNPSPAPTVATGTNPVHVYYRNSELTCCKSAEGTPHPIRVGPLPADADAVSLSGPYPTIDAAKAWLCSSHQIFRAQAWISNWSRVGGVIVSNLPCTPNA